MSDVCYNLGMRLSDPPVWLDVDLGAVASNVLAVRRSLTPKAAVLVVVKANAYGHGLIPVSLAVEKAGASGVAVATADEGIQLREAGVRLPILILGAIPPSEAPDIVHHEITCALCETGLARALSAAAAHQKRPARAHLKVDTGMGRLGILPCELPEFFATCAVLPGVRIDGVFSHLSTSEDEDTAFADWQTQRFKRLRREMIALSPAAASWQWHLANSAATVLLPESRFDAVRVGLLAYGLNPVTTFRRFDLKPAAQWKTRITFMKVCPSGLPISYGRTFHTTAPTRVATLGVGYADGYPRSLSNAAEVLVGGCRAPVIGRVCMDQMMIAIPDGVAASIHDEVVLMGDQDGECISPEEVSAWAGTILHELFARLGARMPRFYHNAPFR